MDAAKLDWKPIAVDKCSECGRLSPGWYDDRDQDMTDAYVSGVSSVRLAKAYGISEERVRQIIIGELGHRAYLEVWHREVDE